MLKGGEGYGPGLLVSGQSKGWTPGSPSLETGGSQDSCVLGKDGIEHWTPGSWVRREQRARTSESIGEAGG